MSQQRPELTPQQQAIAIHERLKGGAQTRALPPAAARILARPAIVKAVVEIGGVDISSIPQQRINSDMIVGDNSDSMNTELTSGDENLASGLAYRRTPSWVTKVTKLIRTGRWEQSIRTRIDAAAVGTDAVFERLAGLAVRRPEEASLVAAILLNPHPRTHSKVVLPWTHIQAPEVRNAAQKFKPVPPENTPLRTAGLAAAGSSVDRLLHIRNLRKDGRVFLGFIGDGQATDIDVALSDMRIVFTAAQAMRDAKNNPIFASWAMVIADKEFDAREAENEYLGWGMSKDLILRVNGSLESLAAAFDTIEAAAEAATTVEGMKMLTAPGGGFSAVQKREV